MSPLTNPAYVALRDLRNIPDKVMLSLVSSPSGMAAVLGSTATFSHSVFQQLWDQLYNQADEEDLRLLLKRHLTAPERDLVLSHPLDRYTLRALLDHNVLTPTEIRRVPATAITIAVDYRAIDYYENDAETFAYLTPHLHASVVACYVMRSSPKLFSDDEVLRHVHATFNVAHESSDTAVHPRRHLEALENLLYLRPHLNKNLSQIPNVGVATALASTRATHYGFVTGALRDLTDAANPAVTETVRATMHRNLTMPISTRRLLSRGAETLCEVTVPSDYSLIKDANHIALLVDRALAYGQYFDTVAPVDLDIPDLATHPLLDRVDAVRLLVRWIENDENNVPVWRRVSYATAVATHRTLCKKAEVLSAGAFEPINPDPVPLVFFVSENQKPRQLTLDDSIEYLLANSAVPKDAACLVEALGTSPLSWQRFFAALDYAPVTTKLRDVISTTSRAGASV